VRGPLVFFLLPAPALRRLAGMGPLRAALRFLLRPLVAFVFWTAVTAVWHVPAIYDAALGNGALHDLEHATFVLAGALVWAQLIDPARRLALTAAGRVFYAWGLFIAGHLATHVILFDGVAHYAPYARQPDRLLGLSPVADQHWAAWAMTIEELVAFGILTAVLIRRIPLPGETATRGSDPVTGP
jgi:cytochrome c oxidase assembly factor CtaG